MSVIKAQQAFDKQKYERCIKLTVKGLKKDKTQLELLYIKAAAEYQLSQDPKHNSDEKNWPKECVKSAIKAKQKDKDGDFTSKYTALFLNIAKLNNQLATEIFNQSKYSKAIPYFKNSYELTGDTVAYGMLGICHWFSKEETEALKIMQKVAQWNYDAFEDKLHSNTYVVSSFEILAAYYVKKKMYDTAINYTEMGLDIFPQNASLLRTQKWVVKHKIDDITANYGVTSEANKWAKRGLAYLPNDSLFIYIQNQFYKNQIGFLLGKKNYMEAEAMHHEFFQSKKELIAKKVRNKSDEFLTNDSLEFITKLFSFFISRNSENAMVHYFYKWYPLYFKTPQINEAGLQYILSNPPANVTKRLLFALMNHGGRIYPQNAIIKASRYAMFMQWVKGPLHPTEFAPMISLCDTMIKDFGKKSPKATAPMFKEDYQKIKVGLMSRAIDTFLNLKQLDFSQDY